MSIEVQQITDAVDAHIRGRAANERPHVFRIVSLSREHRRHRRILYLFYGVEDTHLVIDQDILPSPIPLRDIGQFLFLVPLNQDIPLGRVGKPRSLDLLEHLVHRLGSFLPASSSACILFRSIQHNDG